jgi:hypothetical protein
MATATDGPRLVVAARSLPEHLAEVRLGSKVVNGIDHDKRDIFNLFMPAL